MNNDFSITKEPQLFLDIKNIIDSAKKDLAVQVNSTMSAGKLEIKSIRICSKRKGWNMGSRLFRSWLSSFRLNMVQTAFQRKTFAE
ncbi:MAG: hypothetical protein K6G80_00455 [Treponema sp.]|nr:hypothetical protein [Treponema sp.]